MSKSHTIISGAIILILASFVNKILEHFQVDSSFAGSVGAIVVLLVSAFVMGKVTNNILSFFKEIDSKGRVKNEG